VDVVAVRLMGVHGRTREGTDALAAVFFGLYQVSCLDLLTVVALRAGVSGRLLTLGGCRRF
jgi:hypothetical protein